MKLENQIRLLLFTKMGKYLRFFSIFFFTIFQIQGNRLLFDHKKESDYGDCIGIGLRKKDGRIWLSHNGEFLNELPPSERMTNKEREKLKK